MTQSTVALSAAVKVSDLGTLMEVDDTHRKSRGHTTSRQGAGSPENEEASE